MTWFPNWSWKQKVTDPEALENFIVNTDVDGRLSQTGMYQTTDRDLKRIVAAIITNFQTSPGPHRLMFYCHGGLVSEEMAVEGVAPRYRTFLQNGIYPIFFIWQSTFVEALQDHLTEMVEKHFRLMSPVDAIVDELVEEAAKLFPEPWEQMKKRGSQVFAANGGGWRFFVLLVKALKKYNLQAELHLVGHSAGAIVLATLLRQLLNQQTEAYPYLKLMTCSLYAPACNMDLFEQDYVPVLDRFLLKRFFLFTLNDELERKDHTVPLYHKSILYLVSRGLEAQKGDRPILGMELYAKQSLSLQRILQTGKGAWVVVKGEGSETLYRNSTEVLTLRSSCFQHGGFSFDPDTLNSTVKIIRNQDFVPVPFTY